MEHIVNVFLDEALNSACVIALSYFYGNRLLRHLKVLIGNPDYRVIWDILRKKESSQEGNNEWWSWVARTTPPFLA